MIEIWSIITNILFINIPIPISFSNVKYVPFFSVIIGVFLISIVIFTIKRLFETDGGN